MHIEIYLGGGGDLYAEHDGVEYLLPFDNYSKLDGNIGDLFKTIENYIKEVANYEII